MAKKQSLSERIQAYLKNYKQYDTNKWINGGEIERLAIGIGRKGSTASRICRNLAEKEVIKRRENHKGHVEYQAL